MSESSVVVPVVVSGSVVELVVALCVVVARVVALVVAVAVAVVVVVVPGAPLEELEVFAAVVPVIPCVPAVALAVPAEVGVEVVLAPELWVVAALPLSDAVSLGRSVHALRASPSPRSVDARASARVVAWRGACAAPQNGHARSRCLR